MIAVFNCDKVAVSPEQSVKEPSVPAFGKAVTVNAMVASSTQLLFGLVD